MSRPKLTQAIRIISISGIRPDIRPNRISGQTLIFKPKFLLRFCNVSLQNSHCRLHYELKHLAMFTSMNKHFCPHCDFETEVMLSLLSTNISSFIGSGALPILMLDLGLLTIF